MTDQPHRVDFHRPPNRPVEGCTVYVTPADTDLVQAEERARGFAANTVEPTPPTGWSIGRIFRVLLTEYDRRGTAEQQLRNELEESEDGRRAALELWQRTVRDQSQEGAGPAHCPGCGKYAPLVYDVHGHFGPGIEAEDETFCDLSHAPVARSSPEAPTPVGPQVFNCDQYPHPPVVPCLRCEPVGGSS